MQNKLFIHHSLKKYPVQFGKNHTARELLNHLQIVVHSASSLFELVVNNAQSSVVFNEQIKSVVLIHSQLVSFNGLTINIFVDGFNVTSVGFHVVFAVFSLQINFFEGEGFC